MSATKPIKVWGKAGPNPPKVAMILAELDLPHEIENLPMSEVKKEPYISVNPNGRMPSIQDPNTGFTVWESGAILEYLIETYDKDHKLSFPAGSKEYFETKQWLFFQTTGQAPYFGQAAWFLKFHPEQVPSAVDRYMKEVGRVSSVLDGWLGQQKEKHGSAGNGPWLVGEKMTFADISFVSWYNVMNLFGPKDKFNIENYPNTAAWLKKMNEREKIKKVMEEAAKASH